MDNLRQMKNRTVLEGIQHHEQNPVRVYEKDGVQDGRIAMARRAVFAAIATLANGPRTIVELGCGVLDITGPLSPIHEVIGVECSEKTALHAKKLYPAAVVRQSAIEDVEPFPCDVLVLCEVLEHLTDPMDLVKKWLPVARAVVISHPLDEPVDSGLSGGDHCWSFTENDLVYWFVEGGHEVRTVEKFQMGSYQIGLARGARIT